MERVLAGLKFVAVHLDDVLIFSHILDEHLTHLQLVLDRVKPSKCKFVQQDLITPA